MARKVFISFLGTSPYKECRYKMEGTTASDPVKFVQEAIVSHLCLDWTKDDRIFIFCTSQSTTGQNGSKEINWTDKQNDDGTITAGLHTRLKALRLPPHIEEVDIKAGFTESDIWEVFSAVYDKLQKDDIIFFDATHAFRSIPLFSIVLFNYSRFMKGTHLEKVMYGAFEALGFGVNDIPVMDRIAPIIDISSIVRLQEYNQLASELVTFGRLKSISDSIYYKNDIASEELCLLCDAIDELDEYISTIQLENIKKGNYVLKFRSNLQRMRESGEIADKSHPISRILDRLEEEMQSFVPRSDIQNIEAAIEWANIHGMVLQEYPLAEEYIIYRVIDAFGNIWKEYNMSKTESKDVIVSLLGIKQKDLNELLQRERRQLSNKDKTFVDLVNLYFRPQSQNIKFIKDLRDAGYTELRLRRNSLAHADGKYTYQNLSDDFADLYKNCMEVLDNFSS